MATQRAVRGGGSARLRPGPRGRSREPSVCLGLSVYVGAHARARDHEQRTVVCTRTCATDAAALHFASHELALLICVHGSSIFFPNELVTVLYLCACMVGHLACTLIWVHGSRSHLTAIQGV